jgi:hypothetical protein
VRLVGCVLGGRLDGVPERCSPVAEDVLEFLDGLPVGNGLGLRSGGTQKAAAASVRSHTP